MPKEMTPIEAWHIISKCLAEYYQMRFEKTGFSHDNKNIQAEVICFQAIQEMEKRNNAEKKENL